MNRYTIVLASASPRRIELFHTHGFLPVVFPQDVDETLPRKAGPGDTAMFLALKKGLSAERGFLQGNISLSPSDSDKAPLIISADTIVYLDRILGKPANPQEAFHMLKSLSGRVHSVVTGVCLILPGKKKKRTFYQTTLVKMKSYSDQDILDYIATGEPMDKAGAYAIQGGWKDKVDSFQGDYYNIVGFPWDRTVKEISDFF